MPERARGEFRWASVFIAALSCWFVSALSTGCRPALELRYSAAENTSELPQEHQEEIALWLTRYFGTPEDPHVRRRGESSEDSAEAPLAETTDPALLKLGAKVYQRRCAGCHGVTGDGNGQAAPYLDPLPRDYRLGTFKFSSTPRGYRPRRADWPAQSATARRGLRCPIFAGFPTMNCAG